MSYYQNPFAEEFRGNWVLGDHQQALSFPCPANTGRSANTITVWNEGPYNLGGADADGTLTRSLNLVFSTASGNLFKQWTTLSILIAGVVPAATTAYEIQALLMADGTFSTFFDVYIDQFNNDTPRLTIKSKSNKQVKFYVLNNQAETILKFNARAGVAELPSYFDRHTVSNIYAFTDCQNALVSLNMTLNVDQAIVTGATDAKGNPLGYTTAIQADWQLLKGRSGIFNFQYITFDGSSRIATIVEYPAGAKIGDLGRKITYSYSGVMTSPNRIWETPYQLTNTEISATPP